MRVCKRRIRVFPKSSFSFNSRETFDCITSHKRRCHNDSACFVYRAYYWPWP